MNNNIGRWCICLSLVVASCGNAETAKIATPVAPEEKKTSAVAHGPIDMVCEMPCDTSWTDYTVYNKDTFRFCSEQCKSTFLARPEKYVKK